MEIEEIESPEDLKSYYSEILYKVDADEMAISVGIQKIEDLIGFIVAGSLERISGEIREIIEDPEKSQSVEDLKAAFYTLIGGYQSSDNGQ